MKAETILLKLQEKGLADLSFHFSHSNDAPLAIEVSDYAVLIAIRISVARVIGRSTRLPEARFNGFRG